MNKHVINCKRDDSQVLGYTLYLPLDYEEGEKHHIFYGYIHRKLMDTGLKNQLCICYGSKING